MEKLRTSVTSDSLDEVDADARVESQNDHTGFGTELSHISFAAIWDNKDDAVYDAL